MKFHGIGLLCVASAAAGLAAAGRLGAAPPAICEHPAAGPSRAFDYKASQRAWARHLERLGRAAREASSELGGGGGAHKASPLERVLGPGHVSARTIDLDEPLPESWVGRSFVFAGAKRLQSGARPPEGAAIALTAWDSDRRLRAVIERLTEYEVMPASARLADRLGVSCDETAVEVLSTRKVKLSRF